VPAPDAQSQVPAGTRCCRNLVDRFRRRSSSAIRTAVGLSPCAGHHSAIPVPRVWRRSTHGRPKVETTVVRVPPGLVAHTREVVLSIVGGNFETFRVASANADPDHRNGPRTRRDAMDGSEQRDPWMLTASSPTAHDSSLEVGVGTSGAPAEVFSAQRLVTPPLVAYERVGHRPAFAATPSDAAWRGHRPSLPAAPLGVKLKANQFGPTQVGSSHAFSDAVDEVSRASAAKTTCSGSVTCEN
jgi:hypothetical protein